jgi:very-short-patch-repair endonuclease
MRSCRPSKARTQQLDARARRMRHAATTSEALVFEAVRGGKLGVTFRRQVPLLGRYIADLFASEARLVVEIDGPYHRERREADARRDRALERAGYTVLRLEEELVMRDLPSALARIRAAIGRG